MDASQHNKIVSFIWGVADDVLRDLYVRGKYRDVILPMVVLRRFDAVLEPTKEEVLQTKALLDKEGIVEQDQSLRDAAGQAFYNHSEFTLRRLRNRGSRQQLTADFIAYLDGFSPNVQEILDNFEFRNQIPRLSKADALGDLIHKLLDPAINLGSEPVLDAEGHTLQPALDNHSMGTIFEELVRRFNEENNEEAGEHWTPRDAVQLMSRLIFTPVADRIDSSTYLLYDGACGTGGMLTVAEETLGQLAAEQGKDVVTHPYGQEINAETYAICKADLLLKGEGEGADNIVGGPEHSTLANDAFRGRRFDFMLSNPPYGKSWKGDLERMGGKAGMQDGRFLIEHDGDPEYSLVTRVSDGQMMFLANLVSKMKEDTALGSRIAEVHNGSSLFTGDAGQGESNIRRWIIENDWLEAIVALPPNLFYNTGISTYVWVLGNRKAEHDPRRVGKVQLIDATKWFTPLRKSLGKKSCELSPEDIQRVIAAFLDFEEAEQSKIFPNEAFGYRRVTVERPLRLVGVDPERVYSTKEIKELRAAGAEPDEQGLPVIRKIHKSGPADPLHGRFAREIDGKSRTVEYEPDTDLRDTEQVPLTEEGGVEGFIQREVLPYAPDAWVVPTSIKIGYEINFTQHFYKSVELRPLEEIRADILAVERETEGLLEDLVGAEEAPT
jgi:type I restriction enzyme M protein